jgi:uncharacterized membrane protein
MRSERKRLLNDEGETGRLVTFCDGVFAVAMTVLVFNLQVPQPGALVTASETLLTALGKQRPIYMSYVSSFLLIGIFWTIRLCCKNEGVMINSSLFGA